MPALAEWLILIGFAGGGWYWYEAMRAKELARDAGRRRCGEAGVAFLDDTVSLTRLRLRRDADGQLTLYREFQFEFTSDGSARHGGEITLFGHRIARIEMEPYRVAAAEEPAAAGEGPTPVKGKWLH